MGEATIRDVARLAQVSVATVSRALNGLDNVHPDTRDRILAAAATLGYVPHAAARSLSMARAHAIGVVLPDLHGEFFSECVRGMDREASRRGYLLLLSNMHDDREKAMGAMRAMRGRVDGLLVMAPTLPIEALTEVLSSTQPLVLMNCSAAPPGHTSFCLDNLAGAEVVVAHLVAQGYRHIIHIAGPLGNIDARERAEGYCRAMELHLPGVEPRILYGDFNEDSGEEAAREILDRRLPCDAIFAANDMMALGCMHGLRSAGIAVPEDIAIAGFDDVPLARYLDLTTVQVRIAEMGARAVGRLIDQLEGAPVSAEAVRIAPQLIVRSTTPLRTEAAVPLS